MATQVKGGLPRNNNLCSMQLRNTNENIPHLETWKILRICLNKINSTYPSLPFRFDEKLDKTNSNNIDYSKTESHGTLLDAPHSFKNKHCVNKRWVGGWFGGWLAD